MPKATRLWPASLVVLGFFGGLVTNSPAMADDPLAVVTLPRENKVLDGRLKYARKLAADGKWSQAIEIYDKILRDVGDNLIPVSAPLEEILGTSRSLQVRRQCHLDIAAFPEQALKLYRNTVQVQTKEWLEKGIKHRDEQALFRIVQQAFCCQIGDQALNYLGDLAFEKGDFHQALQWWQMITPPASKAEKKTESGRLLFPNPQVDIAQVRAKMIMAHQFAGHEFQTKTEFAAYQACHEKASGHLAGEKGNYVQILQKWLNKGFPTFGTEKHWPTFAGDAARNGAIHKLPHQRLWSDGPTWSVPYRVGEPEPFYLANKALGEKAKHLVYYPIITNNRVLIADSRSVQMFDLFTGKKLKGYTLPTKLNDGSEKSAEDKTLSRFSLTAADEQIYAVLGDQHLAEVKQGKREPNKSYLVGLKFNGKEADTLKTSWLVQAREGKAEAAIFTGAPLVYQGRVYVLQSRAKGLQTAISLICFDALNGTELWQEELARFFEIEEVNSPAVVDQPTLTLAGNQIVYCSQLGVFMAIDAVSGTQTWAVRYPSRGPITIEGIPSPRDLCPCIYADGHIFAAPMDTDRILCLDLETGQLLWERDRIQVVHLLGCQLGQLVFTTSTGLRAVDAATGSDKNGWGQPGAGRLPPYGRSLILGGWLLWPTQHPKLSQRLVHISDGNPHHQGLMFNPVQVRQIKPGNMAFANDCLIVAGYKELTGYIAPRHFLKKYQQDANGAKPSPQTLYKLAQGEADAGKVAEALKHFQQAEASVSKENWEGEVFQWKCLLARHDLLMESGRNEKQLDRATNFFEQATKGEFPPDLRLKALIALGENLTKRQKYEHAILTWQTILDEEPLRNAAIWLHTAPVRGNEIAEAKIWKLITAQGRKIYSKVEANAKKLEAEAKGELEVKKLDQLLRQYPNSKAFETGASRLSKIYQDQEKYGAARSVYSQLFEWHRSDKYATYKNLTGLFHLKKLPSFWQTVLNEFHAFEKQKCWEAARLRSEELLMFLGLGDVNLPGSSDMTLATYLRKKLEQPIYKQLPKNLPGCTAHLPDDYSVPEGGIWGSAIEGIIPDLPSPLKKTWVVSSGALLMPNFSEDSPSQVQVFYSRNGPQFTCIDAKTGKTRWTTTLPFIPTWLSSDWDLVIVAGRLGVSCLRLEDGHLAWGWTTVAAEAKDGFVLLPPDPFSSDQTPELCSFESDGWEIIFFTQNNRIQHTLYFRLGTFDADPVWLSGSKINSFQKHKVPLSTTPAVFFNRDQIVRVLDNRTIVLQNDKVSISLGIEKYQWTYTPRLPTTLTGEPPQVFAHNCQLLTLLPRNYGYDLERLDPKTGKNVWKPEARLCDHAFGKDSIAFQKNTVYYTSGNTLFARDLENGDLLWKQELQESVRGWRVKATKHALMVFPGGKEEPTLIPVPFGGRAISVPAFTKRAKYPFCLQVHDYKDGKLLQRMEFDGDVYGAGIQFFPDSIVVTAGQKAYGIRGTAKAEPKE